MHNVYIPVFSCVKSANASGYLPVSVCRHVWPNILFPVFKSWEGRDLIVYIIQCSFQSGYSVKNRNLKYICLVDSFFDFFHSKPFTILNYLSSKHFTIKIHHIFFLYPYSMFRKDQLDPLGYFFYTFKNRTFNIHNFNIQYNRYFQSCILNLIMDKLFENVIKLV